MLILFRPILLSLIAALILLGAVARGEAQETAPPPPSSSSSPAAPAPSETPTEREPQEPVKVFTEEVRLPVVAYDEYGRFVPGVELDDVLVLEDGVPQEIRSIQRIPASILFLLDTSAVVTLAKDVKTTRAIALRLLGKLRSGDNISVLQFGDRTELLQDWTTDTAAVEHVLKTKLSGSKRERLAEAFRAAAVRLKERPAGSRHVVLITDAVETPGGRVSYEQAVKELLGAQATVHVISYTAAIRAAIEQRYGKGRARGGTGAQREALPIPDPGMPPGQTRNPSVTFGTLDLDRAMRRHFRKYADETRQGEQRLAKLAEETGGRIQLATEAEGMVRQADEVARDIGAQYVVTYTPKKPLASAQSGEYRRIEVASRRVGLQLRSRRGYLATP
ncbi:MAG TPA: VWA domain-containing protein [Pyrinomonadaceae bacterium]|nr:VWA domain-containing protein [Pyrinomonadaceae bacterium]